MYSISRSCAHLHVRSLDPRAHLHHHCHLTMHQESESSRRLKTDEPIKGTRPSSGSSTCPPQIVCARFVPTHSFSFLCSSSLRSLSFVPPHFVLFPLSHRPHHHHRNHSKLICMQRAERWRKRPPTAFVRHTAAEQRTLKSLALPSTNVRTADRRLKRRLRFSSILLPIMRNLSWNSYYK
jgi:hypothetical protein